MFHIDIKNDYEDTNNYSDDNDDIETLPRYKFSEKTIMEFIEQIRLKYDKLKLKFVDYADI